VLTELIEPGSADFHRIETAMEKAEIHGPDSPVTLTARQVRGLLDSMRHFEDQSEQIEDLKIKQEEADYKADLAKDEADKLRSRLESAMDRIRQLAKASRP